jgi:hypothetical protein
VGAQRCPLCRGLCPGAAVLGGMCCTVPNGSLLADFAKERNLPFCRALPVEALSVGTSRGSGGQGSEKVAGELLDRGALRPFAGDDKIDPREATRASTIMR